MDNYSPNNSNHQNYSPEPDDKPFIPERDVRTGYIPANKPSSSGPSLFQKHKVKIVSIILLAVLFFILHLFSGKTTEPTTGHQTMPLSLPEHAIAEDDASSNELTNVPQPLPIPAVEPAPTIPSQPTTPSAPITNNDPLTTNAAPPAVSAISQYEPVFKTAENEALQPHQASAKTIKPASQAKSTTSKINSPAKSKAVVARKSASSTTTAAKATTSKARIATAAPAQGNSCATHKGYAIQLLASQNKASIARFIADNHLAGKACILTSPRGGATWYLVLYGHYATTQQAHNAINQLPSTLRNHSPWVKNLKS